MNKFSTVMTSPGMYWNLRMFPPQRRYIIRSAINRWSDCIGQDRDSRFLGTYTFNHPTTLHTLKRSDPLLLADVTLRCRMDPVGKVDIS